MNIKFIVKNMSEQFYTGFSDMVTGFNNLSDYDKYEKLKTLSKDLPKNIKQEDNQFNFMVELNMLIKSGHYTLAHSVSPRRGYKVHTFTFNKGE
jgi:hypothetical protein